MVNASRSFEQPGPDVTLNDVIYFAQTMEYGILRKDTAMNLGHECHPGTIWMIKRLRSKRWWPSTDKDIQKHC